MGKTITSFVVAVCAMVAAPAALADEPVAVVEQADVVSADIAEMDTLRAGQVLELARDGRVVIGYVDSCVRETIVGGTVHIGETASRVENGRVQRERSDCDFLELELAGEERRETAAIVFRKPPIRRR